MGYVKFSTYSTAQLAKHIRTLAQNSANVVLTVHVKERMAQRHVANTEVLECLRLGTIRRTPEANDAKGSLECRMERQVLKRALTCVVALCDENPNLLVVTVFEKNR